MSTILAPLTIPQNQILDTFDRANEVPCSFDGRWGIVDSDDLNNPRVTSNQLTSASASLASLAWLPTQYSAFECYGTLAATGTWGLWGRLADIGTSASWDGYLLRSNSSNFNLTIERYTNGTQTVLATVAGLGGALATYMFRGNGSALTGWRRTSTSAWTQVIAASDATYASGYIGVATVSINVGVENFGGGPLQAGPPVAAPIGGFRVM